MTSFGRSFLSLPALVALLGNMGAPASGFRVAPSTAMKKQHGSTSAATILFLSPPSDFPNKNSQEKEMMDQALMEKGIQQVAQESGRMPSPDDSPSTNSQELEMMEQALREREFLQLAQESGQISLSDTSPKRMDPLIASLTRIDEPTAANIPMKNVPLFGEVPVDGNLALLVPAAAIGVLGFIFSIFVAFNSRDIIVQEISKVELPELKYTETVAIEGQCRGLCSNQDSDLDGLRNFMESFARKE